MPAASGHGLTVASGLAGQSETNSEGDSVNWVNGHSELMQKQRLVVKSGERIILRIQYFSIKPFQLEDSILLQVNGHPHPQTINVVSLRSGEPQNCSNRGLLG